jgi:hypothetical protein
MTTLTFQIDSDVADRAQAAARLRHTTLDTLVQEYLDQLSRSGNEARGQQAHHLLTTLRELSRPMGGKPWGHRDELYER